MSNKTIAAFLFIAITSAAGCVSDTGTSDPSDSSDTTVGTQELSLSRNVGRAFFYFVHRGLTKRQSAGIVGNLMQESGVGVSPGAIQPGGPGRGIAQWSVGGRWDTSFQDNVTWFAQRRGTSRWGLYTQLAFTWYELSDVGGYGLSALRHTSTIKAATLAFMNDFEKCGQCDATQRIDYAHEVFNAYASAAEPSPEAESVDDAEQPDEDLQNVDPSLTAAGAAN